MFRKILVPVNGSHASAAGLHEAIAMARQHHARMRFIHVIDKRMIAGSRRDCDGAVGLCDDLVRSGRTILDRARRLAQRQGVEVEDVVARFSNDRAAAAIVADIEDWQPDLVVVGTRNRSWLSRLAHPSDAERVSRQARVPVLIAHVGNEDECHECAGR